jgi:hypothetical protein
MRDMINFVFTIIVTIFGKDKIIYFIKWSLKKLSNGNNIFKYHQKHSKTYLYIMNPNDLKVQF